MPPNKKTPAKAKGKTVATLRHGDKRKNLPTVEYQSLMREADKSSIRVAYERRNRDLDPQFVWRGKDDADWSDLVVPAPPLYIQEKVHPKVLIDDLLRQSKARAQATAPQIDLFADFNGLPADARATEFYQHDANWTNRMILGDSLQVMASLAEREGLRGKVQCIYVDPPYGIKFNSNFQWSTTSRDVKDGNADHITREPEQVKAFRDTWRDGIHSYLTYLRDRLTIARDLLADSGSIFVQIGDENVHRVRAVMDEVFGEDNFVSAIVFSKTGSLVSDELSNVSDYLLLYAKSREQHKFRAILVSKEELGIADSYSWIESLDLSRRGLNAAEKRDRKEVPVGVRYYQPTSLISSGAASGNGSPAFRFEGKDYSVPSNSHWKTTIEGLSKLAIAHRIASTTNSLRYVRYLDDYPVAPISNMWTGLGAGSFTEEQIYVVQTSPKVIQRCMLMATDPGDLVLDPTCGSGTTAYVAEQWGRRWITMDTSRVALALARARIMGARYPYYLLADSRDGQRKEAEITKTIPSEQPAHDNIRHGFVYERVPHITLKSIANNTEIDVIWEQWQKTLEPLREKIKDEGRRMKKDASWKGWEEWEIPREAEAAWPASLKKLQAQWWAARIARQKEIDASIAAKAESEYLYDKPYDDKNKVRVAGPFTVESISPHRVLTVGENDEVVDGWKVSEGKAKAGFAGTPDFASVILENLRIAGVQQAHKEDRLTFTSLTGWPGQYICAEGRYLEGKGDNAPQKRAGILIGPEFGTVSRPDLVAAAREAADANFRLPDPAPCDGGLTDYS